MRVTVLGKSPSWQDAAGACSGYLVQEDGFTLLLDCGNGVFSKLRRHLDYVDVDAVLISHLHADHFLDLVPYSYALSYAPRQQPVPVAGIPAPQTPARPELYVPQRRHRDVAPIVGCWGSEDLIDNAFALTSTRASDELMLGPLRIRFCEVPALHGHPRGRPGQQRLALHLQRRLLSQRRAGGLRAGRPTC